MKITPRLLFAVLVTATLPHLFAAPPDDDPPDEEAVQAVIPPPPVEVIPASLMSK